MNESPKFEKCPVCENVMQLLVDPNKAPENPDVFVYCRHMFYKCYFCGTRMDFSKNLIFKRSSDKTKRCISCGMEMKTFIYPKKPEVELFVCNLCNHCENMDGSLALSNSPGNIFELITVNSIKIVDEW